MRKIISNVFLILVLIFIMSQLNAQSKQGQKVWQWITTMGGPNWDYLNGLETDSEGNIYAGGSFTESLAIENTNVNGNGKQDIFVTKFNTNGEIEWIWSFGSDKSDKLTALKLTRNNDILISGIISGEAEIDGNTIEGDGSRLFIAKLNDKRDLLWIKIFPTKYPASIYKLYESEDKIIAAGTFKKVFSNEEISIRSKGKEDIFLARFNSLGNLEEIKTYGGRGKDIISAMNINNQGNIHIAINYENNLEFGDLQIPANNKNSKNAVIAALDNNFNPLWIQMFKSEEYIDINSISSFDNNSIFLAGNFTQYISYENQFKETKGSMDFFITKLDSLGTIDWLKSFGSMHNDFIQNIKINNKAGVLFNGSLNDTLMLDSLSLICSNDKSESFISQIDESGKVIWSEIIAGENNFISHQSVFDQSGNLFISGNYRGQIEASDFNIQSNGKEDIYIVKYHNCLVLEEKLIQGNPYLCGGSFTELDVNDKFVSIIWNEGLSIEKTLLVENPGTYYVNVIDENNCSYNDSVEIIKVEAPGFDLGKDTTLYCDQSIELFGPKNMSSYYWYNSLMDQNIIVAADGNTNHIIDVWLMVEDTTNCSYADTVQIEFLPVALSTNQLNTQDLSIYPNPCSDYIHCKLTVDKISNIHVSLKNMNGQVVYNSLIYNYISNQEITIPVNDIPNGTYYVEIGNDVLKISKMIVIVNH